MVRFLGHRSASEIQNNWNLPQWKHHRWEEILEVTVGVAPCRSCFYRKDGDHDTLCGLGVIPTLKILYIKLYIYIIYIYILNTAPK